MSLLTQFKLAARAGEIEVAANRSLQQFTNTFDSALADFQRFAADAAVAADLRCRHARRGRSHQG